MTILITGSGGFIGSNLTHFLKKKDKNFFTMGTKGLSKSNHFQFDSVENISEITKIFEKVRPTKIFHLAGSPVGDDSLQDKINIEYAKSILACLKDLSLSNTKIILMGTSAEYGFVKEEDLPINENFNPKPFSNYGISKLQQTNLFLSDSFINKNTIVLRPFNVFGPKMPNYLSISNFLDQLRSCISENHNTLEVGNLDVKRDFIYIDDFIHILWEISEKMNAYGNIYNICSGVPVELKEMVEYMISKFDTKIEIKKTNTRIRQGEMSVHYGDNQKLYQLLEHIPLLDWKKGIDRMIAC